MAEGIDVYLLKECSIKEIEEPIENVCKNSMLPLNKYFFQLVENTLKPKKIK
jgi:hypothetical protein